MFGWGSKAKGGAEADTAGLVQNAAPAAGSTTAAAPAEFFVVPPSPPMTPHMYKASEPLPQIQLASSSLTTTTTTTTTTTSTTTGAVVNEAGGGPAAAVPTRGLPFLLTVVLWFLNVFILVVSYFYEGGMELFSKYTSVLAFVSLTTVIICYFLTNSPNVQATRLYHELYISLHLAVCWTMYGLAVFITFSSNVAFGEVIAAAVFSLVSVPIFVHKARLAYLSGKFSFVSIKTTLTSTTTTTTDSDAPPPYTPTPTLQPQQPATTTTTTASVITTTIPATPAALQSLLPPGHSPAYKRLQFIASLAAFVFYVFILAVSFVNYFQRYVSSATYLFFYVELFFSPPFLSGSHVIVFVEIVALIGFYFTNLIIFGYVFPNTAVGQITRHYLELYASGILAIFMLVSCFVLIATIGSNPPVVSVCIAAAFLTAVVLAFKSYSAHKAGMPASLGQGSAVIPIVF